MTKISKEEKLKSILLRLIRHGSTKQYHLFLQKYHEADIADMAKKLPMVKVMRNPNYSGIYFIITGR